jgi:hypothetical protein
MKGKTAGVLCTLACFARDQDFASLNPVSRQAAKAAKIAKAGKSTCAASHLLNRLSCHSLAAWFSLRPAACVHIILIYRLCFQIMKPSSFSILAHSIRS